MKKCIVFFFVLVLIHTVRADNLESYFMYNTYNSPEGPYVETFISTIGSSVVFAKNSNGKYQAEIEVTMVFYKNNEIVTFRKYTLSSPEVSDSAALKPNFIDAQRIPLENGIYNLELIIKDLNTTKDAYVYADIIKVDYPADKFSFSSLQFIENYVVSEDSTVLEKHGYKMIPYISDFYPANTDRLIFYVEMYNTSILTEDAFLFSYGIERFEDSSLLENFSRFKRLDPQQYNVFLGEINIQDLYSGNYFLRIELRNKNNEMIAVKKAFFQRSKNPATNDNLSDIYFGFSGIDNNTDTLKMYVQSLRPIANNNEVNFIDFQAKTADDETMKNFFSSFWTKRSSADPNGEWMIYKAQVDFVNKWYSTHINKGFATDRGRVYLKYGTPNDIYVSKHEPSAYPYEIWHYYRVGDENNKKFVFYNTALAGEEYELLHSDVKGELRNPNWERLLSKRNTSIYNFDQMNSDDHWGGRARDEFNK